MPKVYILVPVYNRRNVTKRFMGCLLEQLFTDYHLVLIDDGSTDGTSEMVRGLLPVATVIQGKGNWWWAGSLQKGIDWLKQKAVPDTDIVLFINDDVTFQPDYIANAVSYMKDRKGLLLLSKYCCGENETISESGVVADLRRLTFKIASPNDQINCLSTMGLFMRFGDVRRIGDFYPRILPHYLSDYEYTIRAARKGMSCVTTDLVYLCPKLDLSGYRNFDGLGLLKFFRRYFSTKSTMNPFHWTVFVFLAVPRLWVLPNLCRVWVRAAVAVGRQMIRPFNIMGHKH